MICIYKYGAFVALCGNQKRGLLMPLLGGLAPPPTIIALESFLRDGTLFCRLVSVVLGTQLTGWHRSPHSYSQCVANLRKATAALRNVRLMGKRCLYGGVEEHIVRGDWDVILGLLEDLHRLDDKVPPRPVVPENHLLSNRSIESSSWSNKTGGDWYTNQHIGAGAEREGPYLGKDYRDRGKEMSTPQWVRIFLSL